MAYSSRRRIASHRGRQCSNLGADQRGAVLEMVSGQFSSHISSCLWWRQSLDMLSTPAGTRIAGLAWQAGTIELVLAVSKGDG